MFQASIPKLLICRIAGPTNTLWFTRFSEFQKFRSKIYSQYNIFFQFPSLISKAVFHCIVVGIPKYPIKDPM